MKQISKEVKCYQCPGCMGHGDSNNCFVGSKEKSISCQKHSPGTFASGIGKFFLGMPKGFNRIGDQKEFELEIFKTQKDQETEWAYNCFNIPAWKHKNEKGHIFIRGYCPRVNKGFVHIILDGDFNSIKAHEIDIREID